MASLGYDYLGYHFLCTFPLRAYAETFKTAFFRNTLAMFVQTSNTTFALVSPGGVEQPVPLKIIKVKGF